MIVDGKNLANELLDYFQQTQTYPGDDWAFDEDYTELGLDWQGKDGAKFWLTIDRNGVVNILWKNGAEVKTSIYRSVAK